VKVARIHLHHFTIDLQEISTTLNYRLAVPKVKSYNNLHVEPLAETQAFVDLVEASRRDDALEQAVETETF
jgi:hypothetical protein